MDIPLLERVICGEIMKYFEVPGTGTREQSTVEKKPSSAKIE